MFQFFKISWEITVGDNRAGVVVVAREITKVDNGAGGRVIVDGGVKERQASLRVQERQGVEIRLEFNVDDGVRVRQAHVDGVGRAVDSLQGLWSVDSLQGLWSVCYLCVR